MTLHKRTDSRISEPSLSASLTVEAALSFPLFFFAIWMFWQLFLMLITEMNVSYNVYKATKTVACTGYLERRTEKDNLKNIALLYEGAVITGLSGVADKSLYLEKIRVETDKEGWVEIELKFKYRIASPFFYKAYMPIRKSFLIYPYTGVWDKDKFAVEEQGQKEKGEDGKTEEEKQNENSEEIVYVTTNGTVYHRSRSCSYLALSTKPVDAKEIDSLRNNSGKKYSLCGSCKNARQTGVVYVTQYGEKYHYTVDCIALRRNITEKKLKDVGELKACPKCGGM